MNFFKQLLKNIKASQLVEKILIAAFSISAGGAVIVYGASVIKNNTTADIDKDDISGRTYGYNQLVSFSAGRDVTANGLTIKKNRDDETFTISGTSTAYSDIWITLDTSASTIANHKYFLYSGVTGGGFDTFCIRNERRANGEMDAGGGVIFTMTEASASSRIITLLWTSKAGVTIPEQKIKPMLIDLTEWYGAGNEPYSVSEFKAKFPKEYYPTQKTPTQLTKEEINNL